MGEASNHTCPTSMEVPEEKQLSLTPPTHAHFWTLNPINKLTPQHEGSTLYDLFELRAMTRQLNKAIHGSNVSSPPPYIRHLNSPVYRLGLDRIYRESTKTPRRISCSPSANAVIDKRMGMKHTRVDTGGFVTRLWKKVKQGLLRNKKRKEGWPELAWIIPQLLCRLNKVCSQRVYIKSGLYSIVDAKAKSNMFAAHGQVSTFFWVYLLPGKLVCVNNVRFRPAQPSY